LETVPKGKENLLWWYLDRRFPKILGFFFVGGGGIRRDILEIAFAENWE
jgi:hypothetical protein